MALAKLSSTDWATEFFRTLFCFVTFITSAVALADDWACKRTALERRGSELLVCGIGEASQESVARRLAQEQAYREFSAYCEVNQDCDPFEISVDPLRTDCDYIIDQSAYKCFRGFRVSILAVKRELSVPRKLLSLRSDVFVAKEVVTAPPGKVERGVLHFQTVPDRAIVEVDGVESCATPCSREFDFGSHSIMFSRDGFASEKMRIDVSTKSRRIHVELKDNFGRVILTQLPSGTLIKVDGVEHSRTTEGTMTLKLRPSEYVIELENEGYFTQLSKVSVLRGERKHVPFSANKRIGYLDFSIVGPSGDALSLPITVDGVEIGERTPETIKLQVGSHTISVSEGAFGFSQEVSIRHNETARVAGKLSKIILSAEDRQRIALRTGWFFTTSILGYDETGLNIFSPISGGRRIGERIALEFGLKWGISENGTCSDPNCSNHVVNFGLYSGIRLYLVPPRQKFDEVSFQWALVPTIHLWPLGLTGDHLHGQSNGDRIGWGLMMDLSLGSTGENDAVPGRSLFHARGVRIGVVQSSSGGFSPILSFPMSFQGWSSF